MMKHPHIRAIYRDENHFKKAGIHFMRIKPKRVELPDTMLLSEFQRLVSKGDAAIEVDDKGGGTPVKIPVKTLL